MPGKGVEKKGVRNEWPIGLESALHYWILGSKKGVRNQ
ncbi:MAG: hypothetical protein RLZZ232_2401 [Planctomycetota bacterium]|jgi:hypothetical protein